MIKMCLRPSEIGVELHRSFVKPGAVTVRVPVIPPEQSVVAVRHLRYRVGIGEMELPEAEFEPFGLIDGMRRKIGQAAQVPILADTLRLLKDGGYERMTGVRHGRYQIKSLTEVVRLTVAGVVLVVGGGR